MKENIRQRNRRRTREGRFVCVCLWLYGGLHACVLLLVCAECRALKDSIEVCVCEARRKQTAWSDLMGRMQEGKRKKEKDGNDGGREAGEGE